MMNPIAHINDGEAIFLVFLKKKGPDRFMETCQVYFYLYLEYDSRTRSIEAHSLKRSSLLFSFLL